MSATADIPPGSWIVVTGANGFIASYVIQNLLRRGFKVRGTVRDLGRSSWLVEEQFAHEAGQGTFELVAIPNMNDEEDKLKLKLKLKQAVHGVSAIIHIATPLDLTDPDPNSIIPATVAAVENLLSLAAAEESVKSFVYTSTIGAATMLAAGEEPVHIDQHSWNEAALEMAWAPPPYSSDRALIVYIGSKVAAEKAFWKFVREHHRRPSCSFRANTVLPVTVFGPLLNKHQKATTNGMLYSLYNGHVGSFTQLNATRFIDVRDVAAIHVAAALDPSVNNTRLNTWSTPFNWNDVLSIFRKLYPHKNFIANLDGQGVFPGTVDDSLEKSLLQKWGHGQQQDWIALEDGVRDTIDGIWPETIYGW